MSLIGAFYYLRVVKLMYFDSPADAQPIQASAGTRATLAVNGALVLLLGVIPGPLIGVCLNAIRLSLGA
jgi:NADH-quinone oxidoreductase subunit N